MKSIAQRMNFKPTRLPAAVKKVICNHPREGESPPRPPETQFLPVLEKVRAAGGDKEALQSLAQEVTSMETMVLAHALRDRNGLEECIFEILSHRPRRSIVPVLWANIEGAPGRPHSLRLLRQIWVEEALQIWPHDKWKEPFSYWINSAAPLQSMADWADEHGLPLAQLPNREHSPFQADTPLLAKLVEHILRSGSGEAILREPKRALKSAWNRLPPSSRIEGGQNYLSALRPESWQSWLTDEIEDSFGIPGAEDSRDAFWEPVPERIRKAFRARQLGQTLEKVFQDHARLNYWKSRWLDSMRDIKQGMAGRTPYAILDFGRFGVIEFMETGNAAYFYYREDLKELKEKSARWAGALKSKKFYSIDRVRGRTRQDNRLLHSRGWQRKADRRMNRWMKLNG